jgi:hypothetical protein
MTGKRQVDEPVTVFETNDPALLAVAESLLESEGIRFFAKGEALQNLFGAGAVSGFNPITGPVELQVSADDAADARSTLRDLARRTGS